MRAHLKLPESRASAVTAVASSSGSSEAADKKTAPQTSMTSFLNKKVCSTKGQLEITELVPAVFSLRQSVVIADFTELP